MFNRILITGGAGFIGSFLCDELLDHGYEVRVLDNLDPQVHGHAAGNGHRDWPTYLNRRAERMYGDVRDGDAVNQALEDIDAVFHLAAVVGVGQSMYEIRRYSDVNQTGTAVLLECLAQRPVGRLIVASSMSIYGEGRYQDSAGNVHDDVTRSDAAVRAHQWNPTGDDGQSLRPLPTPEEKTPDLSSVYALSKYVQERMCLIAGRAYDIPTVALRFFNVYGPRQALSNPYTGVLAIFASRLLNGNPPLIFEDGEQQRDFVNVRDVARACRLALESRHAAGQALNIGSGQRYRISELAQLLALMMDCPQVQPRVTGKCRIGDIRHCFADISRATRLIGYVPQVSLKAGMEELVRWLAGQSADDRVEQMSRELAQRGLTA